MRFAVHRDEGGQLQQARINLAAHPFEFKSNLLDHQLFQLAHADGMAKFCDRGRVGIRVDWTADQGHRPWLCAGVFGGQIGDGGHGQRRRLADGDDVQVAAKLFHEINKVERVIFDIEFAGTDGDVARIVPIGGIYVAIGQQ